MRRNKLDSEYEIDFELIGIVCNHKEYKLAWFINEHLKVDLIKQNDVRIEFSDNTAIVFSNYTYKGLHHEISLLQNKLIATSNPKYKFLIPELSQFDYLIKLKDEAEEVTFENVSVILKRIPIVEYIMRLNFDNLKSKENLLY